MALRRRAPDVAGDFFPGFADVVEIGSGTLSTTYRARDIESGQWRALKLLTVDDVSAAALERFEHDLTALRALSEHPNIVSVYGSLRTRDGRPVLVLEMCTAPVVDLMGGTGGLPVRDVVSLGVKIAGALETAHRAGMVHRAVTPRTVLVTESGQPALDDFGLAMLQPAADVTVARSLAATHHQAPEQFESATVSPATDIYGLASALYELIVGRAAFAGQGPERPAAVMQRIVRDAVLPLSPRQAPPRLSDLLVASMSKDPNARPRTAADFARELSGVEADLRWPFTELIVRDVPRTIPAAPPAVPNVSTPPPPARPHRPSPRPTPSSPGRTPGWTPPPAEEWFPTGSPVAPPPATSPPPTTSPPPPPTTPAPPAAPPGLPSTDWSVPIRSAPRHARPDEDEDNTSGAAAVESREPAVATPAVATPPAADVRDEDPEDAPGATRPDAPLTSPGLRTLPSSSSAEPADEQRDADGLTPAQYSALEAAAAQAPPTTVNPVLPQSGAARDDWSSVSLSTPPDGPDVGDTTSQPAWRQARAVAAAAEAAEAAVAGPEHGPASGGEIAEVDPNETVAHYPIPPSIGEGDQPTGGVPAWAYREAAEAPPSASFSGDLTLDPMSLRRRVTIRSGGHALIVDAGRIVLRSWLRRTELAWSDVFGFEPRFDGVGASGSGGQLVAITRAGPLELPATKTSMAELRYVQAVLEAYRHRAQLSVEG